MKAYKRALLETLIEYLWCKQEHRRLVWRQYRLRNAIMCLEFFAAQGEKLLEKK